MAQLTGPLNYPTDLPVPSELDVLSKLSGFTASASFIPAAAVARQVSLNGVVI